MRKIKDLPKDTILSNYKVRTPLGVEGWWVSQWEKGIWLQPVKESMKVTPVFVDSLTECMEWDIIEWNS